MYVYKITNLINGKIYIGITIDYKKRWSNEKGKSSDQVISKAIRKYGVENFKFEVLEEGLSAQAASDREIQLIREYDCMVPKGYNVAKGGMYNGGISRYGAENPNANLTREEAQYILDHRDIPEYVLYEKFCDKLTYGAFKNIYLGKTYTDLTTTTPIYPYNLEFSCQFTGTGKLTYGEIVELREMYANGIYWKDAYKKYQDLYPNEMSFWNIYTGNRYSLVMPEVFTPENKHLHSGLSKAGELNGRSKLTVEDVKEIRRLAEKEQIPNSEIYKRYPQVTTTSIRNIISYKTWKNV